MIGIVVGAFFVMKASFPSGMLEQQDNSNASSSAISDLNNLNPMNTFQSGQLSGQPDNPSGSMGGGNLTQTLSQSFFNQISSVDTLNQIKNNAQGSIDLMSGKLTNEVVSGSNADLNLISSIGDSQINVSANNSVSAKKKYLNDVSAVINNDFGDFNNNYAQIIYKTYHDLDPSFAEKAANVYHKLAEDFKGIVVPSDWADTHKEIIVYYENSENIYSAMANYQNDPIKGYMALQVIDSMVNDASNVQNDLTKEYKEISK